MSTSHAPAMRAAFLCGRLDVRIEKAPEPQIERPDEVKIAIDLAGICGSELHTIDMSLLGEQPPQALHAPLGHEYAGRVVAVGEAVETVAVGQRVTVAPRGPCFKCELCRNGASAICRRMTQRGGGWAEYIVAPDTLVYALPEDVSTSVGALTEPLSCAVRILDRVALRPGLTVAVIGAGPIGLMTAVLARHSGAGQVIVSELRDSRREVARRMGLEHIVDPARDDLYAAVMDATQGRGVDISIEAVGVEPALSEATRLVAPGGTVMWGGLAAPGLRVPISPHDMFMREYTLRTSWGGILEFERTMRMEQVIDWSPLVQEVFPLERVMDAVNHARTAAGGKVLLAIQS